MLDSTTLAEHDGEAYCKSCHAKNYGPKGFVGGGYVVKSFFIIFARLLTNSDDGFSSWQRWWHDAYQVNFACNMKIEWNTQIETDKHVCSWFLPSRDPYVRQLCRGNGHSAGSKTRIS